MRTSFYTIRPVLAATVLMTAAAASGRAQAFADQKTALVDYSKADIEPRKACEMLSTFQSKEIAQISAAVVPAAATAQAYCRVNGLLSPEIAFEVSLPARRWMTQAASHSATPRCSLGSPSRKPTPAMMRVRSRGRAL